MRTDAETGRADVHGRPPVAGSVFAIVAGVTVLVASALLARGPVTSVEVAAFRAANDLPPSLYPAVWPLMQYGTFLTIPVLSAVALAVRRVRLAMSMLLSGIAVYLLAKIVKEIVDRGRPAAIVADVNQRETFGQGSLGFPSGHATVAAALTFVVWRHLGWRWGVAALVVGVAVMLGRLYVGAHLPLDLIGGAALGCLAGGVASLVAPPRSRRE
jgi:membrane-associated phospholipid phosphatase